MQAFPSEQYLKSESFKWHEGMTLRDYFAGHALSGTLANVNKSGTPSQYAEASYIFADAMLAERGKK